MQHMLSKVTNLILLMLRGVPKTGSGSLCHAAPDAVLHMCGKVTDWLMIRSRVAHDKALHSLQYCCNFNAAHAQ